VQYDWQNKGKTKKKRVLIKHHKFLPPFSAQAAEAMQQRMLEVWQQNLLMKL